MVVLCIMTTLETTAPDWRSVQDIVDNAPIPAGSFDLFISKRKEGEFVIRLEELPETAHQNKIEYLPIHVPAGLYDLYW